MKATKFFNDFFGVILTELKVRQVQTENIFFYNLIMVTVHEDIMYFRQMTKGYVTIDSTQLTAEKKHIYKVSHDKEQDNTAKETHNTHTYTQKSQTSTSSTFSCTIKGSTDLSNFFM